MKNLTKGLKALTVEAEQKEIMAIGSVPVKLKRTFNQKTYDNNLKPNGVIKFWRVVGPADHKNYQSDLSLDGLKEWGIIQ